MENPYETAKAFALDFGRTEYALKRSDYLRKNKDVAEAAWDSFAGDLGTAFFAHIVKKEIAKTLINDPPASTDADMTWSPEENLAAHQRGRVDSSRRMSRAE